MEKIIDGVTYVLTAIPPHLSPYNTLLGDLLREKPKTAQEADRVSGEIKKCMDKLLVDTVKPTPRPEHQYQVFNALTALTSEVLDEARLFRKDKRSSTEEGSPTSPSASRKAK
jgi:hypothetical protein